MGPMTGCEAQAAFMRERTYWVGWQAWFTSLAGVNVITSFHALASSNLLPDCEEQH